MNPNQSYPSTGEVIDGKYQIERMLGEGGMGAVAKATHLLRRAPVALKFMSPGVISFPGAVERFLNEGVAASQIDSDHVVHIFDVGKLSNGAPYLVMEYMEGHDLAELLLREGRPGLEVARSIYFVVQALRGLQVAHDAGIIHRDMKPSNCFVVNKEGEADFVKLLDFGISKVGQGKSASLTQTNSALGTPLYMSPEQARSPRDVDLRSDLYSVGVILYELLTGRTPFNSESGEFTEILFKLFTQDPPPIRSFRPDLPPELAAIVHRALARDPKDRHSNAAELGVALEPFADSRSARVIQRLRAHQPGRGSRMPSESQMPGAPVAAFSKLALGVAPARTNERAAASAARPSAPSSGVDRAARGADAPSPADLTQRTPTGQAPGRHSALPEAPAARAGTAEEAVAATQYGSPQSMLLPAQGASAQRGKQTDLGAARDAAVGTGGSGKRTSPVVFVVPALLVLAVGAAGVWKLAKPTPGQGTGGTGTSTMTPDTPPSVAPPSAPSATTATVAVPALDAAAPAESAAPAAVASVPPPRKNVAPPGTQTPPSDGRVHLNGIKVRD